MHLGCGQLRGGEFHPLGDAAQRTVECVYGGEVASRDDCCDPAVSSGGAQMSS
jgi:hypothetical protein